MNSEELLLEEVNNELSFLENAPKKSMIEELVEKKILSLRSTNRYILNGFLDDIPESIRKYMKVEPLSSGKISVGFEMFNEKKIETFKKIANIKNNN